MNIPICPLCNYPCHLSPNNITDQIRYECSCIKTDWFTPGIKYNYAISFKENVIVFERIPISNYICLIYNVYHFNDHLYHLYNSKSILGCSDIVFTKQDNKKLIKKVNLLLPFL